MYAPAVPLDGENLDKDELRKTGRQVRRRLDGNKQVERIAVEGAELWAVGGFLDAVECGRLMAMIDAVARPSKVGDGVYSHALRTSDSADINPFDPFVRGFQRRIDRLLGIDPGKGETMQGQRYQPGQEFKPHVDWFTPGTRAWDHHHAFGGQRTFTAMIFLNRVEAGGETDFPQLGIAIEPRPGTLLIWNNADPDGVPNPATIHAGNPVIRGVKYIITKWYRCRPWQAPMR